jgi:hypothetical protein
MAWIIGMLDEDEARELRRRGWKLERPPSFPSKTTPDKIYGVWVDNDMFKIMSRPDWAKGEKK